MYKIELIEAMASPTGSDNKPWYRYIIGNGHNTITGCRRGSKKEVDAFARETAANLNKKYPPRRKEFIKPVFINVSYI